MTTEFGRMRQRSGKLEMLDEQRKRRLDEDKDDYVRSELGSRGRSSS